MEPIQLSAAQVQVFVGFGFVDGVAHPSLQQRCQRLIPLLTRIVTAMDTNPLALQPEVVIPAPPFANGLSVYRAVDRRPGLPVQIPLDDYGRTAVGLLKLAEFF